jgi:hypothetical protein
MFTNLKKLENFRGKLLTGDITPAEAVAMEYKDMVSI